MKKSTMAFSLLLLLCLASARLVDASIEADFRELEQKAQMLEQRVQSLQTQYDKSVVQYKSLQNQLQQSKEYNEKLINYALLLENKLDTQKKENTKLKALSAKTEDLKVKRVITATATAYGSSVKNGGAGTGKTAQGTKPIEGWTIAADLSQIPLGTKVRIECPTYPSINGIYQVQDVGGAIKGLKIDIYMDDSKRAQMLDFGRRSVKIYVLGA